MDVKVVAYGIAKDIINCKEMTISLNDNASLGDLKLQLLTLYPAFVDLVSLSFAVEEEYQDDDYKLKNGQTVVIIPPVSGG